MRKKTLWDACQVPIYIRHSMHMSTGSITAAGVIYMHQSPGRAAAVFGHIHMSLAAKDKQAPARCLSWDPGKHASGAGTLPAAPFIGAGLHSPAAPGSQDKCQPSSC